MCVHADPWASKHEKDRMEARKEMKKAQAQAAAIAAAGESGTGGFDLEQFFKAK